MFNSSRALEQVRSDRSEPQSGQYCSQALMLPALSWLAPATVPQAATNMPVPRTAQIARARLNRATEVGVSSEPPAIRSSNRRP
jgi:hypothetical protein